jgi:cell division protein FtsW (lipid II flippase)
VSSSDGARRASTARATEARLLAFAVLLTLFAGLLLGWSQETELPMTALVTAGALAVIATVAHLTIRAAAPDADPTVLPLTVLLNGLGLVLVRRVDLATGSDLAVTQTVWTAVSVGGMCALLLFIRAVRDLGRYQYTFGLATIVLLLLPLVPGLTAGIINGARLWIDLFGMRFQPGELAKLTMVVFMAGYLERKRALLSVANQRIGPFLLPAPRHLAPVFLAAGMALVIMAGLRDLGSALLFFSAFLAVLYVATGRPAYPALAGSRSPSARSWPTTSSATSASACASGSTRGLT